MVSSTLSTTILLLTLTLLSTSCHGTATAFPRPEQCKLRQVCFALDQSGSIDKREYAQLQGFVTDLASVLSKSSPGVAFSAYGFSKSAQKIHPATKNVKKFSKAIFAPYDAEEATNIHAGLQGCFSVLKGKADNRSIVLITDGRHNVNGKVYNPIRDIKEDGIFIATVGLGNKVNKKFLLKTASKPSLFIETVFADLHKIRTKFTSQLCTEVRHPTDFCEEAYNECAFKFRGYRGLPSFGISGKADTSFTSRIISKKAYENLGVLNTNNIVPEFLVRRHFVPIVKFGSQRFTPTHFKPFSMKNGGSGIGHQTFHGNQGQVGRHQCVRVFFSSYQLLDKKGKNVIGNVNGVGKGAKKCVVFRTK